jgi:hypothetical protein
MAKQEITIDKIGGVLSNINTKVQANTKAIGNFVRLVYDLNKYTAQENTITLTNKPAALTPVVVVFQEPNNNLLTQIFVAAASSSYHTELVRLTTQHLCMQMTNNTFIINIGDLKNIYYISYFTTDPI